MIDGSKGPFCPMVFASSSKQALISSSSCHVMAPYHKSLLVDDKEFLPALHYQNNWVPREEACYTCHTNYAMFGGFRAKMHGLKHVYIHYLRTPPAPEAISRPDPTTWST